MKYLRYFESLFNQPEVIDIEITDTTGTEVGNVSGVIHYSADNVNNWMNSQKISHEKQAILWKYLQLPVAILKNINIEEDQRNRGFGYRGLNLFLDKVKQANSVLLIADVGEENNFNLEEWYKGFGFKTIDISGGMPIMVLNRTVNESTYTYSDGYEFEEDSIDYRDGQHDMVMKMRLKGSDNVLAQIDFTIYQGEVSIKFIKSVVKGRGYGEMLMKEFVKKYKYEDIDFGGMSEEGAKLKRKLDKFYDYDYEKHMDSKNKHFSKDILLKIKDPDIKEFLNNLVNLGYEKAWKEMIASHNYTTLREEYDLNDIAEIANWIKGSLSNDNFPQYSPPEHVLDLLNKIC